jgi:hypothetical protein
LYATPNSAPANEAVVTVKAAALFTVKVIVWWAVLPAPSVTWKVSDWLLAPVAVPAIKPVMLFNVNPAGNVPEVMVQVFGLVPPETVSAAL